MKDYYKILQVDLSAESEVIEAVYKRLALKYHPDKNKSSSALQRMQDINEAYSVLRSDQKRKEYDKNRKSSFASRANYSRDAGTKSYNSAAHKQYTQEHNVQQARKYCHTCRSSSPVSDEFCSKCGTKLLVTCPKCTSRINRSDNFCGKCGANLSGN